MKTSNFETWADNKDQIPGAISISFKPAFDLGWRKGYPAYKPLTPTQGLITSYKTKKIGWEAYRRAFNTQLILLPADEVVEELTRLVEPHEPILLCWEDPKTLDKHPCHRRLVANWLQEELEIEVPEFDMSSAASFS